MNIIITYGRFIVKFENLLMLIASNIKRSLHLAPAIIYMAKRATKTTPKVTVSGWLKISAPGNGAHGQE